MASLTPHNLLTYKGLTFYNKKKKTICKKMLFCINVGFIGLKTQTHFFQDVLFISYNIFHEGYINEHVSLGYNIYYQDF